MKNQLITLILVTVLAIGIALLGWGIFKNGGPAELEATPSAPGSSPSQEEFTPQAGNSTDAVQATQQPQYTQQETQQPQQTQSQTVTNKPNVTQTSKPTAKPTATAQPTPEPTPEPTATPKPLPPADENIPYPMQGLQAITFVYNADNFVYDFGNAKKQTGYVSGLDSSLLRASSGRYYIFRGYFYAPEDASYKIQLTSEAPLLMELGDYTIITSLSGGKLEGGLYLNKGYHEFAVHAFGNVSISDVNVTYNGKTEALNDHLYVSADFAPEIKNLKLLVQDNNGLVCDIPITKSGNKYSALVPPGIDMENAVLSFEGNGKVEIAGKTLLTGQTKADLSKTRIFYVSSGREKLSLTMSLRQLDTGLPCVGITSSSPISSKEVYVDSYFAICGNDAPYGADLPLTVCGAKVRGAYSSGLEKKPYSLKFESKTQILDLTPERSWILVASHLDLSQMRNYTAYEIAKYFDNTDFAPRMRFVDVFVNGEYRGLYLLGDKIDISSTRFTLNQHTTEPDVGVMLELEKDFRAEGIKGYDYFQTPQGWCVTFKDPNADELTQAQRDYIRDYFIAAEAAIISGVGYEQYIDVDSFIDWFLVETLFKNCDSEFTSSIYFHKDTGGKLKMGPVWDFDSGLGNHEGFPELLDHTGWQPRNGTYFQYLMADSAFREKMSKRWFEMHHVVENYNNLIDSTVELIRKSYNENFKVYDILQNGIWPVPSYISSQKSIDGQAAFMKDWVAKRIAWLDNEFSKPNYDY